MRVFQCDNLFVRNGSNVLGIANPKVLSALYQMWLVFLCSNYSNKRLKCRFLTSIAHIKTQTTFSDLWFELIYNNLSFITITVNDHNSIKISTTSVKL